jgi:PAS domain S-box-containing protein
MSVIVAVLIKLGQSMVLWLAALWVYQHALSRWPSALPQHTALLLGLLVGAVGLLGIARPVEIAPGVVFDGRTPLVVLAGAWAGPFAALVAGSLGVLDWLWVGGPSAPAAIVAILSGAALGALAWASWGRHRPLVAPTALALLGLASALISLLWAFVLGIDQAGGLQAAPLMMLGYTVEALLVGATFAYTRYRPTIEAELPTDELAELALRESEERYARLADAAFEGLGLSENGIIVDVNAQLAKMFGYDRKELIGQAVEITVAPQSRDLVRRRALAGYSGPYEHLAQRKDGSIFPVEARGRAAHYRGRPIRVTAVRDISERMAAQQALARSERMFKELVQSVKAVVWEADAQTFAFSFVSEQAEKLLGYPVSAWLESPSFWVEHIHPDDRDAAVSYCVHCTKALANHEFEYRMIAADGRVVWLSDLVTVVVEGGQAARLRGVMVDVTARHQAEEDRASSEVRFQTIFEQATLGIALVDMKGSPIETNSALQNLLGYSADELRAMSFVDFTHPEDVDTDLALFHELVRGAREFYHITKRYLHKDGQVVWANLRVSLVHSAHGEPQFAIGMVEDITERKRIEAQYLQAQKMGAIGRLAGGIAHDFNNLLTVILGNCELLLGDIDPQEAITQDIAQIREAADRATMLTRQLLAFSRKQLLNPTRLDLNMVVANVEGLLRRLIGEDILLISRLDSDLNAVQADPGQIEQVIMNLAVNARDAMPNGGTLIIETANAMLDASNITIPGTVTSGRYCMLAVSDTGCGMDAATQARIFEPFFTTKAPGKGTGLGLATVYGIVQQSGGYIWIYSEPDHGTTFKIYLPQAAVSAADADTKSPLADVPPALQDSGTIMLIEDDPLVRDLARRVLEAQGYCVLEAGDGVAALRIAAQTELIDVLLTDVIIPGGMSGPQVAQQMHLQHPDLQVLYMSGYTDAAIEHHAGLNPGQALLQKPFTVQGLARAVWNARRIQRQPAGAEGAEG